MAGGTNMDSLPLQLKQLFFNNLQLLGFDAPAMEASNHIPFNKTMFDLPNKRGAEIVLQFLFNRLNPTMCREAFRDCWPILDKKKEREFRKTCSNWLTNITREEADSHLPRINASLFMSPGGDKFYELMFQFSGYVLQKVIDGELGCKSVDRLKYPALSSQNIQLKDVIMKDITCSSIRHRQAYFQTSQQTLKANTLWKDTANDYVREYRKLNKGIRELDYKIREEQQRAIEASQTKGSDHGGAVPRRGQSDHFDPHVNPQTIRRAQQIQQVRDMWKKLEDFDRSEAAEREVIESIVERTIHKHQLDAADINIKVPDMLLRECAEEIRRRNVDNTYQGGKLNLVSVLQLWNLCLHLYLEKLHQVGVPKFEEDVKKVTSQVHTQQNYFHNAQTLRQQMSERVPVMKTTIEELREKLDSMFFGEKTPESIRTTSIGLDLVEPSPQPSFSPEAGKTPAGGIGVPRSPDDVATPEAAVKISEGVMTSVRQLPKQLFPDPDMVHIQQIVQDKHRKPATAIPKPGRGGKTSKPGSRQSSRQSSRPTSARSRASAAGSIRSAGPTPTASPRVIKHTLLSNEPRPTSVNSNWSQRSIQGSVQSQGSQGSMPSEWSKLSVQGSDHSQELERSRTGSVKSEHSGSGRPYSGRSESSETSRSTPRSHGSEVIVMEMEDSERKTAADYLVDEILGEADILSPYTSGLDAFMNREKVARSPELDGDDNKENIVPSHDVGSTLTPTHRGDVVEFEDVLGPELVDDYDNVESDDSGKSEENVIIIDRSIHKSPPPPQNGGIDRFGSPEATIDQERFPSLGGSPISPMGGAIVIDRSFHQFDQDNSPRLDPDYRDYTLPDVTEAQWNQFSIDKQLKLSETNNLQQKTDDTTSATMSTIPRPQLPDSVRSPLTEEIRKMFHEALANTSLPKDIISSPQSRTIGTPQRGRKLSQEILDTPNKGSRKTSGNGTFIDQVELEDLIIGQDITRRDSDYFSHSGYLSHQLQELQLKMAADGLLEQEIPESPKVLDILRGVKSMEEQMFGAGTPLESDAELELPNMDPRSRLDARNRVLAIKNQVFNTGNQRIETKNQIRDSPEPDFDIGTIGKLKVGDISWDFTENLADIEMPDIDLDKEIDDIVENIQFGEMDVSRRLDGSVNADRVSFTGDTDNLDDFFATKTPELPKRTKQVVTPRRGEGDGGTGNSLTLITLETPPRTAVDESPLISFTP